MSVVKKTETKLLALRLLILDRDVQLRGDINHETVREYAEAMANGDEFPPVVVFHRDGLPGYYVADGFHRVRAALSLSLPSIRCEIRDGSKRDAILYAASANCKHGLRRTSQDKRRAVVALLLDSEWSKWTTTEIARRCQVSAALVEDVRSILDVKPRSRTYQRKNGTKVFMSMGKRGEKEDTEDPDVVPCEPLPKLKICRSCGQVIPD